jgi:hypothetical protein
MRIATAALMLVLLLLGPAHAAAAPQHIAGDIIDSSAVADARGDAAIAYQNAYGAYIRLARPNGRFGSPILLSSAADSAPLLAMDTRGDVVAAWTYNDNSQGPPFDDRGADGCCERVRVAELRANGRIVAHETLPPGGVLSTPDDVAISPDGRVVAVLYSADRLRVRIGRFGHGLGAGASFAHTGGFPSITSVTASASDSYVTYSAGKRIYEARVASSGRVLKTRALGTLPLACPYAQQLPGELCGAEYDRDGAGRRAALYGETAGAVRVATWPAAGGAPRVQTLGDPATVPAGTTGTLATWGFAQSGLGLVAWCDRPAGQLNLDLGVPAAGLVPAAAAPADTCSDDGLSAAVNSHGQALVAELRTPPAGAPAQTSFAVITRNAAGRLAGPRTITSNASEFGVPFTAIDEKGGALMVWSTPEGELLAQRLTVG